MEKIILYGKVLLILQNDYSLKLELNIAQIKREICAIQRWGDRGGQCTIVHRYMHRLHNVLHFFKHHLRMSS